MVKQNVGNDNYSESMVIFPALVDVYDETTGNSNKEFAVPEGEVWKIHYVYVELSTTATVGDRIIDVLVRDPNLKIQFSSAAAATVAAGTSTPQALVFMPGSPRETTIVDGQAHCDLPIDFYITGGSTLIVLDNTSTDPAGDDMVVGFQYSRLRGT